MTDLRFIGDFSILSGFVLSLLAAALAWWLYWRETRVLSSPANWMLPSLRAAAIALSILILTAPVRHHRYQEGEPGRLVVLVDSSKSMSVSDEQLAPEQKQAIAQSLGWTDGRPASSQANASSPTSESNSSASDGASQGLDASLVKRFDTTTRYQRAIDRLLGSNQGLLPQVRDAFEVTVARFDRDRVNLWESTLKQAAPLPITADDWGLDEYGPVTKLGSALVSQAQSGQGIAENASGKSAAGKTNEDGADGEGTSQALETSNDAQETLVVLTDGRNTQGPSPLAVAESLSSSRRRVYIVGIGSERAPQDISLLAVEHPERIFERDVLRGTLVVRSRMTSPEPLKVSIKHAGEVVWQETRALSADDQGRIDFALPVEALVKAIKDRSGRDVEFSAVPLHLEATIEPQAGEAVTSNNIRPFHVSVITKRSRMLIVDGRSRWEVRYLRNMFERDPAWQVDSVLPDLTKNPPTIERGEGPNRWPSTREQMSQYDLIVLGDLPAGVLPRDSQAWLKHFVESSGGGLIVIDGQRGHLQDKAYDAVHDMLPVKWRKDNRVQPPPVALQLTSSAKQLAAFQLTPNEPAANDRAWAELPDLHFHTLVEALPGSELLATVKSDGADVPLMATRQYGAGRVFYSGTDETWRWRYKVADTYHQRFWNQVSRWVMRLPMSVQGQYVGIDSGKLQYAPEEPMTIRARLRNAQGQPATDLTVEAHVSWVESPLNQDSASRSSPEQVATERVVAVVPLEPEKSVAGVYSGQLMAPRAGNYRVRIVAPGLTSAALDLHTEFAVAEPDVGEMDQLSCDVPLLTKLAEMTGGKYLPEERGHELADLLQPLSRGKIVESDTLLWQSYWWFLPIVLLLCMEWWLRKRVGLI